jgi:hypothetical protein
MDARSTIFSRDRRFAQRHIVKTALRVRVWKSDLPEERAESVNLSRRGIFFATNSRLSEGEVVEILLKMPEEITGEPPTNGAAPARLCAWNPPISPRGSSVAGSIFIALRLCSPSNLHYL